MIGAILSLAEAVAWRAELRTEGKRVVFTNGCFDILHRGHVEYLKRARDLGDALVVGLNSDTSVRRVKGDLRPILPQDDRAAILASLRAVDVVTIFDEDTPYALISALVPDILAKGADWKISDVVGRDVVEGGGGRVVTVEYVPDRSTSVVIDTIRSRYC